MKNKFLIITSCIVLFGLIFSGCTATNNEEDSQGTEQQEVFNVETEEIQKGDITLTTYAIGQLSPDAIYTVTPLTPGEVVETYFETGDSVKKDDILFILDSEDFNTSKSNQLSQLQISLDQAKLSLDQAKDALEDNQKLFDLGSLAESQLEASKNQVEQAKLQYKNVLAQIRTTKDSLNDQEENLVIKSPADGIIANKNVEKDMYATNQNGYTIIKNNPIVFNAGVVEKYINQIEIGQETEVYINALDKSVLGEVTSVSLLKQGNTYPVEITLDNSDLKIKPDMFAEVNIDYTTLKDVVIIPSKALITSNGEEFMYVICDPSGDHHTVKKVYVEVLNRSNGKIQIKSDDLCGQLVITKGNTFINGESLVNIVD